MIKKAGVLGAGTMGAGIAQVMAQSGITVVIKEVNKALADKGAALIEKNLQKLVSKGRLSEEELSLTMSRLIATDDVSLLADADLVIEAAVEDMEIKKSIFKELDDVCKPETILATNTSALSVTEIAAATGRADRVIGMHFFNPVPAMKLVEIISGLCASDETRKEVIEVAEKMGKTPVEVEEAPGFVVNRILIPMINEGIGIVADGVSDVKGVDNAMKLGANHPMGPLQLGDLIGLDVCLAIMETLHREYGEDKYRPHPLLRKMVRAGKLGRKSGEGFYDYH